MTKLPDENNVTGLPESEDGLMPSNSHAGQQLSLFGPQVFPASHSRKRVKCVEKKMKGMSGQTFPGSSKSIDLTQSLANRCQQLLSKVGSMEYSQTWRQKATPAGRLYWAHTASVRRTCGKGCTGLPAPMAADGKKAGGWATPTARDWRDGACQLTNVEIKGNLGRQVCKLIGGGEYIACLDGKSRRVKSSICPLADGVSGRVGLLRGAGNAIVPQVAAVFIRVFMSIMQLEENDGRENVV